MAMQSEYPNIENIKKLSWKKHYEVTSPLIIFQKAYYQKKLIATEPSSNINADELGYTNPPKKI